MILPPDQPARNLALTCYDRTLLIEAGAGSGKTAILAGRVALMLASGIPARSIVAITFTEAAASELSARIRNYVDVLGRNETPPELAGALSSGLTAQQLENLRHAKEQLAALTCTTIHGFCRRLVTPYPVETNSDPGAGVTDPITSNLLMQNTIDEWLRQHLSQKSEGYLVELVQHDAKTAVRVVREIVGTLTENENLKPPPQNDLAACRRAFAAAATAFVEHVRASGIHVPEVEVIVEAVEELLERLPAGDPRSLVALLAVPPGPVLKQDRDMKAFRVKGKYEGAAAAHGLSKVQAGEAYKAADERYVAMAAAWPALRSEAASLLLAGLMREAKLAVDRYQERKRSAALLDFNDLIRKARQLLATNEPVRKALSQRYQHVLVDEFQDTDPNQAEILWRLCGEANNEAPDDWTKRTIRPGALFLVGDPKQAIYRFRGADIAAYTGAREAVRSADPNSVLAITTNFRSRAGVLEFVNERFEGALSAGGQPGFTKLDAYRENRANVPAVARLTVAVPEKALIDEQRELEAAAVAQLCADLLANHSIDGGSKGEQRVQPRHIALLAPTGSGLHAYEEALERLEIPVSSQAGKTFWQRQEVQDMVALTRVLADGRDTLALLALLRGPLVGLTDEELLDATWKLPPGENRPEWPSQLSLNTPLQHLAHHPLLHSVIERLQWLQVVAASTTPHHVLTQAVERLSIRPLLKQRHVKPERALANVQAFLELARPYAVRGLQEFATTTVASWDEGERTVEGRADVQEDTVVILTMHASKGLEWPIVIPINTMSAMGGQESSFVNREEQRHYRTVLGAKPNGFDQAHLNESVQTSFERQRLWYVAATRARETLIVPWVSVDVSDSQWRASVDLGIDNVAPFGVNGRGPSAAAPLEATANEQTREQFEAEAQRIASLATRRRWTRPSRDESAEDVPEGAAAQAELLDALRFMDDVADAVPGAPPQGGWLRGNLMHKLIEEVLTGELNEDLETITARAHELIVVLGQTPADDASRGPSPDELARTVLRALTLPAVAALRPGLEPELFVYATSTSSSDQEEVVVGVADAIKWAEDGTAEVVVDWKSDVKPSADTLAKYVSQVREYLAATGTKKGLIVFATRGESLWVSGA